MTKEQFEVSLWLNRVYYADKKLSSLMAQEEKLFSIAERVTSNISGNSSGGTGNGVENSYNILADLQEEIEKQKKLLVKIYKDVNDMINAVDDEELQTILRFRYLSFEHMQAIAIKMNYDKRTVQRKHIKALEKVVTLCHCMSPLECDNI